MPAVDEVESRRRSGGDGADRLRNAVQGGGGMDVRVATGIGVCFISESEEGTQQHPVEELRALVARDDGLV
jgi:hypothetical protein